MGLRWGVGLRLCLGGMLDTIHAVMLVGEADYNTVTWLLRHQAPRLVYPKLYAVSSQEQVVLLA